MSDAFAMLSLTYAHQNEFAVMGGCDPKVVFASALKTHPFMVDFGEDRSPAILEWFELNAHKVSIQTGFYKKRHFLFFDNLTEATYAKLAIS